MMWIERRGAQILAAMALCAGARHVALRVVTDAGLA